MADEDFDLLYGGQQDVTLVSAAAGPTSRAELEARVHALENELESTVTERDELKEKLSQVEEQNTALKRNISCLYKTAKLEIKRWKEQALQQDQQPPKHAKLLPK
ncbi:uncharacterized protein MONBRDRAFT_26765 [Monosiga brevicollis MX1]|uniref:Uncharacterized protein n=1 Tax=Monosiga brevicollis TaxID=81824 RepID=A9V3B1_MONBE|nr:uncharacterized protein MONBRDRAFT_26765 [Monosiga brevicollis MX1]EDQ88029.1 predicted protein [Monosiga brevicollis MX1]|eukprot:XP_001747105.1 hypothetical protein [Monosiga brevicollis MX1]